MFEAHFQTFEDPAGGGALPPALAALRDGAGAARPDGFIVPRADGHQNEYVPPSEERLAWLTGFTGSAGLADRADDRAAMFVDGRYTLQARAAGRRRRLERRHPGRAAAGQLARQSI